MILPTTDDTRAYWQSVRRAQRAAQRRRKGARRQAARLEDAQAMRSALWRYLDRRWPSPAYRSGRPGADWVRTQLRKSAMYRCVLGIVLGGMSAMAALRLWDREAGPSPTPAELLREAEGFRASMG
jgi:hypothetical protein